VSHESTASTRRRRLLILAICCLSLFIVGLDNTVVNIALPAIQQDLDAPTSGLQWVIDADTLVLASLLMLSGSIADRIGRRKVFQTGLVLFVLGSLACSPPTPGNAPRRSASGAAWSASAWRSARCSAGSWSTAPAGRRSS